MSSGAPNPDGYIHARTAEEYERLRAQARAWENVTRRVLKKAGVSPGMSCLDVGCGPGEAMRVMAEFTGPSGHVAGFDVDGTIGRYALAQLQSTGLAQFAFHEGKVETADALPGGPYDVTFTRITLLHIPDAVAALRKMKAATKPGGIIIAQDYDFSSMVMDPQYSEMNEFETVFYGVFKAHKRHLDMGRSLARYFRDSGIGDPDGTDAAINYGPLNLSMYTAVYNGLVPAAIALGLTDETKAAQFRTGLAKAAESGVYNISPALISVWKRIDGV